MLLQEEISNSRPLQNITGTIWINPMTIWNDAKIIIQELRDQERLIKEAITIQKAQHNGQTLMNRKGELTSSALPAYWDDLLLKIHHDPP